MTPPLTRVALEGGLPSSLPTDLDAHDNWFRAKVDEAVADLRPAIQHNQVMQKARSLIINKRNA